MKKLLSLQLILLFVCIHVMNANAQDSTSKAKPAQSKPVVKSATGAPVKKSVFYKPYKRPYDSTRHTVIADTAKATAKPDIETDKSLNGQYQYLLSKIYYYQQPLIGAFHKSMMDTLTQARMALKASQAKLAGQTKTIDSLQNSVKANTANLSESNAKSDEVSWLGIPVDKSTYNLIMWGLVVIFGAAAAIVITRSGAAGREAKYRTQLYNELEEEYKNYKIKANEKEKKLARELQTERNKLDDLLGRE